MIATIVAIALATTAASGENVLHDFTVKDIDGADTPLASYKGKVVLVVNVASKCGLTPQYKGLEALYQQNKERGFTILGFPANEFKGQEPGTNAEIKEFCSANYDVTFPMFEKIVVKGDGIHPLYKWLVESGPRHEEIEWNFAKFLVDRSGRVIARFHPKVTPESEELKKAIEDALASK